MLGLLIADDDAGSRIRLAELLRQDGYDVVTTHSAAHAIEGVLKDLARVVILGSSVDGLSATQLLPVLKKCKADLKVIIASEEPPLDVVRRLRREGIFYYLVKPLGSEDGDEVRQVVQCAFDNVKQHPQERCGT
ncbi:MAG: response regulator [Deferrisomatales bacterium]|nr:response regulator [Deferrisomatales bacterium]